MRTIKKLALKSETLRQLGVDDVALIYGGDRTERTDHCLPDIKLRSLVGCKPPPPPPAPIYSWASCGSCVGFQCPPGTNKTVFGCAIF